MVHQLVVGRAQQRIAGMLAPAHPVDHALRVLHPKANGKRFGFHEHAALPQHREGVARAVAQRQHHLVGAQGGCRAIVQMVDLETADMAILDQQVAHAALEAHLAAERDDARAQALHHLDQLEGADMGVRMHQDFRRRSGLHELFHHLAAQVAGILDLTVELAVGKRAGAALAELDVRLGMQHLAPPQAPGVLGASAHLPAALQHDRTKTHLRQHQGGKDAAGAKPHHYWSRCQPGGRLVRRLPRHRRSGTHMRVARQALQQRGFLRWLAQGEIDDVHGKQLRLAGIKAAFEHLQGGDLGGRHRQHGCGGIAQQGFGVIGRRQRKFQFGNSQHPACPRLVLIKQMASMIREQAQPAATNGGGASLAWSSR